MTLQKFISLLITLTVLLAPFSGSPQPGTAAAHPAGVPAGLAHMGAPAAAGLVLTPGWSDEGDQASASFGELVAPAGDVNGDGFADLLVAAPAYDAAGGLSNAGRVSLYLGAASGLSPDPAWSAEGELAGVYFGDAIAAAGDVNGDGYDDVIIGAPFYSNGQANEGRAYVYHGRPAVGGDPGGLTAAPVWWAESDWAGANFGLSVAAAGDVNADGFGDVIVGAPYFSDDQDDEGRAYVYYGSAAGLSTTPAWTAESHVLGLRFGISVASAGDVDNDGDAEVAVGTFLYAALDLTTDQVFVYYGAPVTGLSLAEDWSAAIDASGDYYSPIMVAPAGDVNNDTFDDLILGAPSFTGDDVTEGKALVYHGSGAGLAAAPAWSAEGDQATAQFGLSVASAGDVNNDGFSDVIVGAPGYSHGQVGEGRAFVYHGAASNMDTAAAWTAEPDQADAWFGYSVAGAGDLKGDGYADVVVGAPYYTNGSYQEGAAFVYYGQDSTTPANTPPAADAGPNQTVPTLAAVALNGSASSDPDGHTPLAYLWSQTGGPAVMLSNPTAATPTFPAPGDPAVLTFTLSVTDSLGLADPTPDAVTITVLNQAPAGDAGPGQAVDTLAVVTLAGSASDPDDDEPFTYYWTQTDGLAVTLSDSAAADPSFTAPGDPTTLKFSLVVTDSLGKPDPTPASVFVTVANQAPTAHAGPDQSVPTLAAVTLDGSASSDPDGDTPLTYLWSQVSGPVVTLSSTTLPDPTFTAPGDPASLTFQLQVADSLGRPAPVFDQVVISVGNQPPSAQAGPDQQVSTLALVTLAGSGSDPDGHLPLAYHWTQTGGPPVTLSSALVAGPTFTAPADPAVLTFELVVTDMLGMPDPTPDPLVISVLNQPPAAHAGPDQSVPTLATVSLAGGGSDPDGDLPLAFHWTQTGGLPVVLSSAAAANPGFTAPGDPAVLTFSLAVTDSLGLPALAGDSVTVIVNNQRPSANAGPDQVVMPRTLVTLVAGGSDPDGDLPLAYHWTQTGGPPVTLSDPAAAHPTFTAPPTPAVLTFSLAVTDSLGLPALAVDVVVITVLPYRLYLPLLQR